MAADLDERRSRRPVRLAIFLVLAAVGLSAAFVVGSLLVFGLENYSQESLLCKAPDPVNGAAQRVDCPAGPSWIVLAGPIVIAVVASTMAAIRCSDRPIRVGFVLLAIPALLGLGLLIPD